MHTHKIDITLRAEVMIPVIKTCICPDPENISDDWKKKKSQ